VNASIHLRTTLQGVPGASAVVRGKVAAGSVAPGAASLASRAEKVAAVAAEHAVAVDRDSRFPAEAMAAARAERRMGIAVPRELGGEGAGIGDVLDVCYVLGRACAATAMVYAMHQTKVACLARHGSGSAWHRLLLRRLCNDQMLLASSTTEGQSGGDVRNSAAPIERQDSRIALERQAGIRWTTTMVVNLIVSVARIYPAWNEQSVGSK
jgi:acyl-CoA dehydrogenase